MRFRYTTIYLDEYDLERLPGFQRDFVERVITFYGEKPQLNEFNNYWVDEGKKIWGSMGEEDIAEHITFKICQDLETRLFTWQRYREMIED